jgi:DNA-binding transcriptional MerR regulator
MIDSIMDIGEVAKKSGISTSALRYYEEIGLIKSNDRKGLRRQYSERVLETLALITLAKQAGFKLEDLSHLFKKQGERVVIDRNQLKEKSIEVSRRIKQLEASRDGLIHASQCKAPSHLECPKFLRLMSLATKKQARKKR